MRKLRVFDPFSLPLGLSSVLLERREGRKERHQAAATAACSETGPPKPTMGVQPGSGSQACPKPALTPREPEPEIPNPGPGASSSWCWPQSPCGWWYPAPGNNVGRNKSLTPHHREVWAQGISYKPKHLALCVQWRLKGSADSRRQNGLHTWYKPRG